MQKYVFRKRGFVQKNSMVLNQIFFVDLVMPRPRRNNGMNKMLQFVLQGQSHSRKRHRRELCEDVDLALGRCHHMKDLLGYSSLFLF